MTEGTKDHHYIIIQLIQYRKSLCWLCKHQTLLWLTYLLCQQSDFEGRRVIEQAIMDHLVTLPWVFRISTAVQISIEEVRHFSKCKCMEYVVYYAQMAGFNILSKTFLAQFCCIALHHHKGCNTIYYIIQNPVLHRVRVLLNKDPRIVFYFINST